MECESHFDGNYECRSKKVIFDQKGDDHDNPGSQETEFNEYMLVGLGFGLASIVAIGMMIYCRKYKSEIVKIKIWIRW